MRRTDRTVSPATRALRARPLRVVHVVNSLALGGMEKGIATCASYASPDVQHAVVCLTESGRAAELFPPGTPVRQIHKPPGNSLRAIVKLARALRRFKPCVVHTRNWAGMDGIVAARLAGIGSVLHGEHGWEVDDLHGASRKRRLMRRHASSLTRGFTCVSKHIASWLTDAVKVRCKVTQIYNGVDTDTFRPGPDREDLRRELGVSPEVCLVGHVGRLVSVKNHDALFRAFHALKQEFTHAMLVCVGDGPRESELRALAGPGIRLLGHRKDIPRVLRALDLFVLPSLNEGISNTILEAMATGLPVIATDVGGNSELVARDKSGILVPVGDNEALVDALRFYLTQDRARVKHGREARQIVLERFKLETMVRAYEEAWRDCASRL